MWAPWMVGPIGQWDSSCFRDVHHMTPLPLRAHLKPRARWMKSEGKHRTTQHEGSCFVFCQNINIQINFGLNLKRSMNRKNPNYYPKCFFCSFYPLNQVTWFNFYTLIQFVSFLVLHTKVWEMHDRKHDNISYENITQVFILFYIVLYLIIN